MAYLALMRALEKIAKPVIRAYHADLTVHDARILNGAQPGDTFLWAPRECGTYMVVLARGWTANARAKEHYDAIIATGGSGADLAGWYLIGIERQRWTVMPCTDHAAVVERWAYRAGLSAEPVRELNL